MQVNILPELIRQLNAQFISSQVNIERKLNQCQPVTDDIQVCVQWGANFLVSWLQENVENPSKLLGEVVQQDNSRKKFKNAVLVVMAVNRL